ncbi:MAG: NAD(P)H-dependent oxidoreductase [Cryobacterium sp.]|nr:NAD(P)H-dependent oxidoreductase [Oligoflexia bacterium]
MLNVAVIIGSTRPERKGEAVAKWVHEVSSKRTDARYDLVDLLDFNLPLLDEPVPASANEYSKPHTKAWAAKMSGYDAFVFVTPEYNHGTSGALKNAIDYLYKEWNNKSAGLVGYGGMSGARAIEQLRLVLSAVKIATVSSQVGFSLFTDFEDGKFKPSARAEKSMNGLLDEVISWGTAMKSLRK